MQKYPKDVRIVFRHQPLPFHPNALPAAKATMAANKQGKFWEMHDKLFENQTALGTAPYERFAQEIGLDVPRFKRAYETAKYRARVEEDQKQAVALGIGGTPTMVVNGERVVGAQPYESLKTILDRKLAEAK
jgi:protein-disulfide isomerase